jgi:hypothetical protein
LQSNVMVVENDSESEVEADRVVGGGVVRR